MVELEVALERRDQCYAWLSDDERERAARFRFDLHRDRFVVCRGNLRELLGERLGYQHSRRRVIPHPDRVSDL